MVKVTKLAKQIKLGHHLALCRPVEYQASLTQRRGHQSLALLMRKSN